MASDLKALLISLKAGGEGLNLGSASLVIMVDPWWNPQVEFQALHRAQRIGSPSDVTCIRMVTTDTIEERVITLQKNKLTLFANLVEGLDFNLTFDDYEFLLGIQNT
jgi:DNA repair protein RAD16